MLEAWRVAREGFVGLAVTLWDGAKAYGSRACCGRVWRARSWIYIHKLEFEEIIFVVDGASMRVKGGKGGDFVILRGNGGILCYGGCWHLHRIESWYRGEARIEFMRKWGRWEE